MKVASGRILHQPYGIQNVASYPLKRRDQQNNSDNIQDCGVFFVSTQYFERKFGGKISEDVEYKNDDRQDVGFWLGINPDGAWEEAMFPPLFQEIIFLVEEVFQNQYYHPTEGWGNKHLGSHLNYPGQWSTRDYSYSSKDFFEPALPLAWQWTSTWTIDKSQSVDAEGWAYGPDFQSLRWPPSSKSSSKSASDTVRRRRWTRPRQQSNDHATDRLINGLTTINPRCCAVLPWKSTLKDSGECFLVRPSVDSSEMQYSWGRAIALSGFNDQSSSSRQTTARPGDKLVEYIFKLNELEKKDILLICSPRTGNKQFWLSVGTDASILHTEINTPIYDWRISVTSPLELENRLPSIAEFTLWERTKEGNFIDQGSGIIPSRKVVHIYSADLQKPLYISIFVHGGWLLEKDPVLVLDSSSTGHISSFWIVHQQSKRKLRVNVE
ncbi:hypothetical protein SAY86_007083 [Trapa natans]|uniref:Uncharacterized protein n=1 Tax=Trapa natans TaxID=22666 RepID=A0AAN7LDX7_TRANT|nr:hypothetical protein SAY86_007083 [Trapa natans]